MKTAGKVILGIFIGLVIIALLIGLSFGMGWMGNRYDETITKEHINIEHENFKQSNAYLDGIADDLAGYKYELMTEENEMARKAMIELIIDRTSNIDPYDLDDPSLINFLIDVKNGSYN